MISSFFISALINEKTGKFQMWNLPVLYVIL